MRRLRLCAQGLHPGDYCVVCLGCALAKVLHLVGCTSARLGWYTSGCHVRNVLSLGFKSGELDISSSRIVNPEGCALISSSWTIQIGSPCQERFTFGIVCTYIQRAVHWFIWTLDCSGSYLRSCMDIRLDVTLQLVSSLLGCASGWLCTALYIGCGGRYVGADYAGAKHRAAYGGYAADSPRDATVFLSSMTAR